MEEEAASGGEDAPGARKRKRVGEADEDVEAVGAEPEEVDVKQQGLPLLLLLNEDEEGCYAGIAEEAVAEVMRYLEAEISDDAAAGFVTINGDEETCGPSFSCAASTVMASVDTRAAEPPPPRVPWPVPDPAAAAMKKQDAAEMDDVDAAWLDELLACARLDGACWQL